MADAEKNQVAGKGDKGLARDVAHLYAWAKVSQAPYRTFVRTKPQVHPLTEVASKKKASALGRAAVKESKSKHDEGTPSPKAAETAKVRSGAESGEPKIRSAIAVASVA